MTGIPPEAITGSTTRTWYGEAALAYEQGCRDGAAAERDRIRQLAEQVDARWIDANPSGKGGMPIGDGRRSCRFADLLDGAP